MSDEQANTRRMTFGPPIRYWPVCRLTPWGFIGGPWGYRRVETAEEAAKGPIIVDQREEEAA